MGCKDSEGLYGIEWNKSEKRDYKNYLSKIRKLSHLKVLSAFLFRSLSLDFKKPGFFAHCSICNFSFCVKMERMRWISAVLVFMVKLSIDTETFESQLKKWDCQANDNKWYEMKNRSISPSSVSYNNFKFLGLLL